MKPIFIEVFDRESHGPAGVFDIFERERMNGRKALYVSVRLIFQPMKHGAKTVPFDVRIRKHPASLI